MTGPTPVAKAELVTALRDVVDDAGIGLPERWHEHLANTVPRDDIHDRLDTAVASADLHSSPPRWWRFVGAIQWILAISMVIGIGWLVLNGLVAWAGLPDLPMPKIGNLWVPTWLLIGGAVKGLLIALIGRVIANVAAKNRSRQARQQLLAACTNVATALVAEPLNRELARMADLSQRATKLATRR